MKGYKMIDMFENNYIYFLVKTYYTFFIVIFIVILRVFSMKYISLMKIRCLRINFYNLITIRISQMFSLLTDRLKYFHLSQIIIIIIIISQSFYDDI